MQVMKGWCGYVAVAYRISVWVDVLLSSMLQCYMHCSVGKGRAD